jgi:hypothetical protein
MQPTSSEPLPSAYRTASGASSATDEADGAFRERFHPVLFLVWAASVARVVGALCYHEVVGTEATLALMTAVALTWYAVAARRPAA